MDDEPGDRIGLFVRQFPVQHAVEVTDRHGAVHRHAAVRVEAEALDREIVLVADVADDLFEDVLERHQSHDLAVFVDHQREMLLAPQELLQLVLKARGGRDEPGLERDRPDVEA